MTRKWMEALVCLLFITQFSFAQQEHADDPIEQPPKFIKAPPLEYPVLDRFFLHAGRVVLELELKPDGVVNKALLRESSGWQGLDDQAIASVYSWEFSPAKTRSGKSIPSKKVLSVDFKIDSSTSEEWASVDLPKKIKRALDSYHIYKSSSQALIDACSLKGFDVTEARKQFEVAKKWPDERIPLLKKYLDDVGAPWTPPIKLEKDYEKHIKLDELSADKSEAAKLRCRRIIVSFELGGETFERFDSYAYGIMTAFDF